MTTIAQWNSQLSKIEYSSKSDQELFEGVKKGDKYALYELAVRFEKKEDFETAIIYYTEAAKLGDTEAPLKAAQILNGQKRFKEAIPFLQMSIECTNDAVAHTILADYYVLGEAGNFFNRRKKAFEHYLAAAKQGNPTAQFNLALAYVEGNGTAKSVSEYIFWLRCSQLNGYPQAVERLYANVRDRKYIGDWREELEKVDKRISKNEEYIEEYIRREVRKQIDEEENGKP